MADVVLDASALVIYAKNDLQALPVDELLKELHDAAAGRFDSRLVLDLDEVFRPE